MKSHVKSKSLHEQMHTHEYRSKVDSIHRLASYFHCLFIFVFLFLFSSLCFLKFIFYFFHNIEKHPNNIVNNYRVLL